MQITTDVGKISKTAITIVLNVLSESSIHFT